MSELKELGIVNFCNGAAVELFQRELNEVLKNIDDPNTKPDAARTITLTFTFLPDASRDTCTSTVDAKSKIVPVHRVKGQVWLGKKNGKPRAFTHDINQMDLDLTTPQTPPALVVKGNSNA